MQRYDIRPRQQIVEGNELDAVAMRRAAVRDDFGAERAQHRHQPLRHRAIADQPDGAPADLAESVADLAGTAAGDDLSCPGRKGAGDDRPRLFLLSETA